MFSTLKQIAENHGFDPDDFHEFCMVRENKNQFQIQWEQWGTTTLFADKIIQNYQNWLKEHGGIKMAEIVAKTFK